MSTNESPERVKYSLLLVSGHNQNAKRYQNYLNRKGIQE